MYAPKDGTGIALGSAIMTDGVSFKPTIPGNCTCRPASIGAVFGGTSGGNCNYASINCMEEINEAATNKTMYSFIFFSGFCLK